MPAVTAMQFIEKIEFILHPTFIPSRIVVKRPPFELQRTGWGTFEVGVKIHFIPSLNMDPVEESHVLSFNRRDTFKLVGWKFDLRRIRDLPQDALEPAQAPGAEDEEGNGETEIARRARLLNDLFVRRT